MGIGVSTFIKRKVEDAVTEYIKIHQGGGLDSYQFAKGHDREALTVPRIEIIFPAAEPELIGDTVTGNWFVTGMARIVTNKNDTSRDAHALATGEVEDLFMRTDVAEVINNIGIEGFTLYSGVEGWMPGSMDDDIDDNDDITECGVRLYCAPSIVEGNP